MCVHVIAGGDITANAGGNIDATAGGTVTFSGSNASLDAGGNLWVAGNIVANGTVTDSGCTLATHTHNYVAPVHPAAPVPTTPGSG